MPELPEVETVRQQLHEQLRGFHITHIDIWKRGREFPRGSQFIEALVGKRIRAVERRAKLLMWRFDDDSTLIAHLKMTGRFVFVETPYAPQKHDRIRFDLQDPLGERKTVIWADIRQFGFVKVITEKERQEILNSYGPEPLEHSAAELTAFIPANTGRSIKSVLLDQTVIAGLGNIYADEACHRAKILPTRPAQDITRPERLRLMQCAQEVLRESLARKGTSANNYVDTKGERGSFVEILRVYGRGGEPCLVCKTPIEKITHVQRGTHFCPTCQI